LEIGQSAAVVGGKGCVGGSPSGSRELRLKVDPGYNTADNSGSDNDSSSTEFSIAEKSKKRSKKSSPTSEKSVPKKSKKADEVPFLSNPYQPIAPEDYEPDKELSNEEEQYKENYPEFPNLTSSMPHSAGQQPLSTDPIQSQQPHQPKKKHVPPIIIDDPSNTVQLIKSFNELTDSKVEGKLLSNNRLKVFPTSAEAHRTIRKEITKKILNLTPVKWRMNVNLRS
ncbi:hypothetical protein AVEN_164355-1, partial [Araneus ventricosus]